MTAIVAVEKETLTDLVTFRGLCHPPFVKVSKNNLQIWIFGKFLSATPYRMETYCGSANVSKLKIY
jgi:hypothetical protein